LRLNKKYKTIIAALMLVLYAFIAIPVSYWHHHNSANSSSSIKQHQQTIEKTSVNSADANCKICSHHYSVANNDAITVYVSPESFFTSYNTFFYINNITNPGYSQSNKGPPALA